MAYEPLEGTAPLKASHSSIAGGESSNGRPSASSSSSSRAWQQERGLVPMLCHLAGLLSWHCLGDDSVWREQGLLQVSACLEGGIDINKPHGRVFPGISYREVGSECR